MSRRANAPRGWESALMRGTAFAFLCATTAAPYFIETSMKASEAMSNGDWARVGAETVAGFAVGGFAMYKAIQAGQNESRRLQQGE